MSQSKLININLIQCLLPVLLLLIQGSSSRNIVNLREINGVNKTTITSKNTTSDNNGAKRVHEFELKLTNEKLFEVREYDRMKCFPLLLCTLTKSEAFKKLGEIDLNELADSYLKLLSAFPGGPQKDMFSRDDNFLNFKADLNGNREFQSNLASIFAHSTRSKNRVEDEDSDSRSSEEEKQKTRGDEDDDDDDDDWISKKGNKEKDDEEMLLTDPRLHQKEKLEMKKLMEELIDEEKSAGIDTSSTWTEKAMALPLKIPMKIGTSLFKNVVLPYLIGDRRRRKRDLMSKARSSIRASNKQNAIKQATKLWSGLNDVKQCNSMYPSCPFEAWEVVSMINLISPKQ